MSRRLPTRRHRPRRKRGGPARRFALGLRVALLAVLAQIAVSIVHQFPHDHLLPADTAAAAGHAHHGHDHENGPATPSKLPDPQACVVGQMLQHLAAVLPSGDGSALPADWDSQRIIVPGDADFVVVRPSSPAQPRAPPPTA
jgi:hypothetical protein